MALIIQGIGASGELVGGFIGSLYETKSVTTHFFATVTMINAQGRRVGGGEISDSRGECTMAV